jgi:hypothetical protein
MATRGTILSVVTVQRALRVLGRRVSVDGLWGTQTKTALADWLVQAVPQFEVVPIDRRRVAIWPESAAETLRTLAARYQAPVASQTTTVAPNVQQQPVHQEQATQAQTQPMQVPAPLAPPVVAPYRPDYASFIVGTLFLGTAVILISGANP